MKIARDWKQIEAFANTKQFSYLPGVAEALRILADPNASVDNDDGEDEGDRDDDKDDNPNDEDSNCGGAGDRRDSPRLIHVRVPGQVYDWYQGLQKSYGLKASETIERLIREAHETETQNGDSTDAERLAA